MTPNKEDYLKCIYEIGTEEGKISNKEIANRMQVSPPAVTEMIKKLISEDLIIKDKVKGYLLTKTGKINVAELYRKHRLIEVFWWTTCNTLAIKFIKRLKFRAYCL